ncbi:hypothetical protein [Alicyclobacillus fastidiosus]|uniref:SAP domain-containing protein n=1 Tax=Alicyclobacillus fastidiosus TaxID=392011 RepID=A0ABV5AKS5_9BACL|nr:hypothetical protein [Alicyclobacillus fastidiosus]WEH08209.1 hypothetical protein PYS47_16005 [Alicyclobacillus fastidiosus]
MITITIDDSRLESAALIAFAEVLKGVQSSTPAAPTATPETSVPGAKAQRRRRTEPTSDPTPDAEPNEAVTGEAEGEPSGEPEDNAPTNSAPSVDTPSVVDLRAKAQEKGATSDGKKAIKALLNEFESKSISDVPEEKRAEFLARLEDL